MPNNPLKSTSTSLLSQYNKHKSSLVSLSAKPVVCEICYHCWYSGDCLRSILLHQGSNCCIYEFVKNTKKAEETLENIVKYCCSTKCRERDLWQYDPIPHTAEYCEKYCPIALFIRKKIV